MSNQTRPSTANLRSSTNDADFIDNLGVLPPSPPTPNNATNNKQQTINAGSSNPVPGPHREFIRGNQPDSVLTTEGVTVLVVRGSISDQMCGAIVNSVGGNFSLSDGLLSKTILQKAGDNIQKELTANVPKGYKYGDVVVTDGHRLNCSYVFHGVLLHYSNNGGKGDPEQVLRKLLRNVLNKAEELKLGSVAIPAIGTGGLAFPTDRVVDCLFSEADRFSSNNPNTSVNEIRFTVYDKDEATYNAFQKMLSQITRRETSRGRHSDVDETDYITNIKLEDIEENVKRDTLIAAPTFRRRGYGFPENWTPAETGKLFKRIEVKSGESEFKAVTQKVMATKGNSCSKILKIERIENRSLYQMYIVQKETVTIMNGDQVENERSLWHGTSADGLENICAGGFNRSYCGKNATVYGLGVYFAKNFVYSAQNLYSRPDANGSKYIFLCKVLTGTFTKGDNTMIEPEIKSDQLRHDSTVDDVNNPTIFVVFKDARAYPEYLITFVN